MHNESPLPIGRVDCQSTRERSACFPGKQRRAADSTLSSPPCRFCHRVQRARNPLNTDSAANPMPPSSTPKYTTVATTKP